MKRLLLLTLITLSCNTFATDDVCEDPFYYGTPEHHNFVIRWEYQKFCTHAYDPRTSIWRWPTDEEHGVTFKPERVQPGDIIFVRVIPQFFKEMHPQIKVPYIIVSAGECLEKMKPSYKQYLDEEKVVAWFGVHPDEMAMNHPKFYPLPLGILQDPYHYAKRKQLDKYFKRLRAKTKKKHWVYMNFAFADKPERKMLHKMLKDKPYCKRGHRQGFKDYLHQMATCRFAVSPEGLGPDCYRTWESLLVGTIPIVRTLYLDPLYEGLPVLIVEKWDDLNEEYLKNEYQRIRSKKYDISRLYTDYWTAKITQVRQKFRKNYFEQERE